MHILLPFFFGHLFSLIVRNVDRRTVRDHQGDAAATVVGTYILYSPTIWLCSGICEVYTWSIPQRALQRVRAHPTYGKRVLYWYIHWAGMRRYSFLPHTPLCRKIWSSTLFYVVGHRKKKNLYISSKYKSMGDDAKNIPAYI